ncbi:MAG: prepilin-type N-terminal cleavage/methylation domain-containing protein [Phycisphaera sp.]|nr:prepilin-type N-terminal cleavage/methylation domain-containing protein [Phycisphaera sp.]
MTTHTSDLTQEERGRRPSPPTAFTLVELLVVVTIISLLVGITLPSLASSRDSARGVVCMSNLHALGQAVSNYQSDNAGFFPDARRTNYPTTGVLSYFWGTNTSPVSSVDNWLLRYANNDRRVLWCPMLPFGTYVPQGVAAEQTTTYGYNGWCLDPVFWFRFDAAGQLMPRKRVDDIKSPTQLFVFVDAAMYWKPSSIWVFQNSTSLDPVTTGFGPNNTPTTHFRHHGSTQALTADGHAQAFGIEDGSITQPEQNLGFVGANNVPHYDQ